MQTKAILISLFMAYALMACGGGGGNNSVNLQICTDDHGRAFTCGRPINRIVPVYGNEPVQPPASAPTPSAMASPQTVIVIIATSAP